MTFYDEYSLTRSKLLHLQGREEINVPLDLKPSLFSNKTLLKGIVYDLCENTIDNATVSIYDAKNKFLFKLITNKKGRYHIKNLLQPGKYYVTARADGYLLSNLIAIDIRSDIETGQDFYLTLNNLDCYGIVYGRVFDSTTRKPLENIKVSLFNSNWRKEEYATTYTNSDGQYIIYNINPDNCYLLLVHQFMYVEDNWVIMKMEENDKIQVNFRLELKPDFVNGSITGTVSIADEYKKNIPVFLFKVEDNNDEVLIETQITNNFGMYQFNNIPSGDYIVKTKLQNGHGKEEIISI